MPGQSYPTTDVPVQELPQTLRWLTERLLPDVAWPFIAHAFDFALNDKGAEASSSQPLLKPPQPLLSLTPRPATASHITTLTPAASSQRDGRAAVRVSEAFIVKYNASSGQRLLKPHRDGAPHLAPSPTLPRPSSTVAPRYLPRSPSGRRGLLVQRGPQRSR